MSRADAAATINVEDTGPFPSSDRVIYDHNLLDSVICQLRFPPVLRIEAEPPAAFQDALRSEYPLFTESGPLGSGMLPPEFASVVRELFPANLVKVYNFMSADGVWQVSLTREWLALTCKHYQRFDNFRGHLKLPFELLLNIYKPAFFSRIGLRYRDVICRSKLGLAGVAWDDLLREHIVSELHSMIAPSIEQLNHQLLIRLQGDAARLAVNHGLTQIREETCYVIDSDFHTTQQTETKDAGKILTYFSHQAWRYFRWCVTDTLHAAMGPHTI